MYPVKLAWFNTKNYVHKNNMTGLKWLIIVTAEGVLTVTKKTEKDTSGLWKTEQQYWEKNGFVADMIDAVIVDNPNDVRDNNKISFCDADSLV
jgi:hypothetical protein